MNPIDSQTLVLMGTIFSIAVTSALWLESRFRKLERLIYVEMDKHRREDDEKFDRLGVKVQRLELKEFGFTQTPSS